MRALFRIRNAGCAAIAFIHKSGRPEPIAGIDRISCAEQDGRFFVCCQRRFREIFDFFVGRPLRISMGTSAELRKGLKDNV